MIFVADENIQVPLIPMLNHFEPKHKVCALIEHFPRGTADVTWMKGIASKLGKTAVALCGDGRILTNGVERKALKESNLMFVHLASGWTNTDWNTVAWKMIKVWPEIIQEVEWARVPTLFQVKIGNLKVLPIAPISGL